jgi:hypothetical protein
MSEFAAIAGHLGQPIVLVGFVIFLFFGVLKQLVDPQTLKNNPALTARIGVLFLTYGFIIALVTIVLGIALAALPYFIPKA